MTDTEIPRRPTPKQLLMRASSNALAIAAVAVIFASKSLGLSAQKDAEHANIAKAQSGPLTLALEEKE